MAHPSLFGTLSISQVLYLVAFHIVWFIEEQYSWGCGAVCRDTWEWLQLPWSESTAAIGAIGGLPPRTRVITTILSSRGNLLLRNFCQWFWHVQFGGR